MMRIILLEGVAAAVDQSPHHDGQEEGLLPAARCSTEMDQGWV
jgi:hypothetical protein